MNCNNCGREVLEQGILYHWHGCDVLSVTSSARSGPGLSTSRVTTTTYGNFQPFDQFICWDCLKRTVLESAVRMQAASFISGLLGVALLFFGGFGGGENFSIGIVLAPLFAMIFGAASLIFLFATVRLPNRPKVVDFSTEGKPGYLLIWHKLTTWVDESAGHKTILYVAAAALFIATLVLVTIGVGEGELIDMIVPLIAWGLIIGSGFMFWGSRQQAGIKNIAGLPEREKLIYQELFRKLALKTAERYGRKVVLTSIQYSNLEKT